MPTADAKPMTSNVELLPLPKWMERFVIPGDAHGDQTLSDRMTDYARANVEHHTATKDAEIEALLAEARTLVRQNGEWQARAERLAEALQLARDLAEYWAGYASEHFQKKHNLEGDLALLDDALRDHEQEVGNWTCEMRPND